MKDKYKMTREQCLSYVKRNIVDYIWKSANLEGIAVTYPDTQSILDGINSDKYTVDEIVAINNLKHAWQFILDNVDIPIDYYYVCKVNQLVGFNLFYSAGKIRTTLVNIGGTAWKPNLPIESKIKEELDLLLQEPNNTEKAINLMLWLMRSQMFIDGNKRVAMLIANKVMIENGVGIITIPHNLQSRFYELLIEFYETNNIAQLKNWLYENCLDGIEICKVSDEETDLDMV